jgi:hypothetical protein
MKKITLILAFIGMITLQSCSVNEAPQNTIDNDTISEVFEYSNVNFLPNSFSVVLDYPHTIYASDMVLVYRLSGVFQGEDVWKLQPESFYFDDGTLDFKYNFNFTRFDTEIYMEGFDLISVSDSYRINQIFRVVIVPGYFGNKSALDTKDYKAVVKALHIDETKIQKIQ